ncbi:MAG: glycolate oxidase subunit GlcD [Candidatus Syntrophoarchaeum sp. GoM_oil]|nr:MAG: glycolate oxidase subunit GlcD [Candidatus Syntrophoarchaeum sp. GoM_oil]
MVDNILKHFKDIVGSERATTDDAILLTYARDQQWPFVPPRKPDYIVRPTTTTEVQQVIRIANRHKIPVVPYAQGVNVRGLCIAEQGGIILDMRDMNQILEVNEDMMTAVIEPGVRTVDLAVACREKGLRPAIAGCPGVASAGANYMLRGLYHHMWKDGIEHVLGMEIVLPNGNLLHTGSWGFPNTLGPYCRYGIGPDMTGLFQNQPGTMGVFTKLATKLYPKHDIADWVVAGYDDISDLVKVIKELGKKDIGASCMGMHWLGYAMLFAGNIKDVFEFKDTMGEYVLWAVLEAETEEDIIAEEEKCEKIVRASNYVAGGEIFPIPEDIDNEFTYPRIVSQWFRLGNYYAVPFFAPIDMTKTYYEATMKLWLKHNLDPDLCGWFIAPMDYLHHGQAVYFEVETFYDSSDDEERENLKRFTDDFNKKMMEIGMFSWFRPNPGNMGLTLPGLGNYANLWKQIKDDIDPNDIMNPGKVFVI